MVHDLNDHRRCLGRNQNSIGLPFTATNNETMSKYLNSHGLKLGLIPANQPCPFLDKCKFKVHTCPTEEKPRSNDFSCAAARLHSAIAEATDAPGFRAMARNIVEKEDSQEFHLPKRATRLSFSAMQAVVENDRDKER